MMRSRSALFLGAALFVFFLNAPVFAALSDLISRRPGISPAPARWARNSRTWDGAGSAAAPWAAQNFAPLAVVALIIFVCNSTRRAIVVTHFAARSVRGEIAREHEGDNRTTEGICNDAPRAVGRTGKVTGMTARKRTLRRGGYLERMSHLHKLAQAFLSAPDLQEALNALLAAAEPIAAVSAISIILRNRTSGIFEMVACKNLDDGWRNSQAALELSKAAIESGEPVMITNADRRAIARALKKHGLRAYYGVPLAIDGDILGVIGYYSAAPHGFSHDEQSDLMTLTGLSTGALQNALTRADNAHPTQSLQRAAVSVETSERAKAEFLSVMSHEFRTPLNLIMGYAGMMQEGLIGELSAEQKQAIERILHWSDELLGMIVSILQASSIEAGAVDLKPKSFKPSDVIERLQRSCPAPTSKEVELFWNCPQDLPALTSDPEKLTDILEQLIDNAIKFTERGRIVVSAALTESKNGVEFAVSDTGIGIPSPALPHIFEMFRQSDSSITRAHGGVGLGLYIVKKYVELLDGALQVESTPGQGTIVKVVLPPQFARTSNGRFTTLS